MANSDYGITDFLRFYILGQQFWGKHENVETNNINNGCKVIYVNSSLKGDIFGSECD